MALGGGGRGACTDDTSVPYTRTKSIYIAPLVLPACYRPTTFPLSWFVQAAVLWRRLRLSCGRSWKVYVLIAISTVFSRSSRYICGFMRFSAVVHKHSEFKMHYCRNRNVYDKSGCLRWGLPTDCFRVVTLSPNTVRVRLTRSVYECQPSAVFLAGVGKFTESSLFTLYWVLYIVNAVYW